MKKLSEKITEWIYFGTPYVADESVKRHIIFSNVIFLCLPIVYTTFIFIDLKSYLEPGGISKFDRLVVPIVILLCISFLMLNKLGLTSVSRVLFLISWLMLVHIIPIILHHSPSDYYLAFPLGIIFHSVLIHVSFSARRERFKFWLFIIANFIVMLMSKDILEANDQSPISQNVLRTDPYFVLDTILYWLLFNLLMFYIFDVVEYYIGRMDQAKTLITKQSEELVGKNRELEKVVTSLQEINQHVEYLNRTLEHKVIERTKELRLKNEKLVQYAHINAHLLRGPFCRVKGLVMLRNALNAPVDEEINDLLMKSLDELDEVTIKIQRAVETNESDEDRLI